MTRKLQIGAFVAALSLVPICAGTVRPVVPTIRVVEALSFPLSQEPLMVAFALPRADGSENEGGSKPRFIVSTQAVAETERRTAFSVSSPTGTSVKLPNLGDMLKPAIAAAPDCAGAADAAMNSTSVSFALPRYSATPLDRETIAACLVLEAASQGEFGMRAVMAVVRNRARGLPELFVPTVLREKQFSALNKVTAGRESLASAIRRARRDRMWALALDIVDHAMEDSWHDPTGGATHYTRSAERTHWTRSLAKTTTIGAHSFYR